MSYLRARMASTRADWAFVRAHVPAHDEMGDFDWPWLQRHVGRDAWVLLVSEGAAAPEALIVYQISGAEGMLWLSFLYCRPGFGARHQRGLLRILSAVAEQCGVSRIGTRSMRPGFARVLERLGLVVTTRVYAEYQADLLLLEKETDHGRREQALDHDGHAAAAAAAC